MYVDLISGYFLLFRGHKSPAFMPADLHACTDDRSARPALDIINSRAPSGRTLPCAEPVPARADPSTQRHARSLGFSPIFLSRLPCVQEWPHLVPISDLISPNGAIAKTRVPPPSISCCVMIDRDY